MKHFWSLKQHFLSVQNEPSLHHTEEYISFHQQRESRSRLPKKESLTGIGIATGVGVA